MCNDENIKKTKYESCSGRFNEENSGNLCLDGELGLCKYWADCPYIDRDKNKKDKIDPSGKFRILGRIN